MTVQGELVVTAAAGTGSGAPGAVDVDLAARFPVPDPRAFVDEIAGARAGLGQLIRTAARTIAAGYPTAQLLDEPSRTVDRLAPLVRDVGPRWGLAVDGPQLVGTRPAHRRDGIGTQAAPR